MKQLLIQFALKSRLYILILLTISCVYIKVEEMKPELITRLKLGSGLSKIELFRHGQVYTNIPFRVPLNVDRVFVVDYKNSLIKVFLKNGNLDFIIGYPKQEPTKEKVFHIALNRIGHIVASEAGEIFVQSFPTVNVEFKEEEKDPFNSLSGTFHMEEPKIVPSFIFYIPPKTTDAKVLGIYGENSEPFEFIESLYSGEKGKFFVSHKLSESLVLSYFNKGILKGRIVESEITSLFTKELAKYRIVLEKFLPEKTGTNALVMLSFFDKGDNRLKFRRIYRYRYNDLKPEALLKEFQNPSEMLFANRPNKEFITIQSEEGGESLKLLVHDSSGNHIANKRIRFSAPRDRWKELYQDFNEGLYSVKIDAGYLEIYEWK